MGFFGESGAEAIRRRRQHAADAVAEEARVAAVVSTTRQHLADRWLTMRQSPCNVWLPVRDRQIQREAEQRRRTKVCIYGAGLYGREAPLDDPSWEVWALNLCVPKDCEGRARADVWFDLHQRVAQSANDLRWIAMCPMPIYVPPDLEGAGPTTVHYPLTEIEAACGVSYFTCTFAYQVALVLHEGHATDIGLYGVELAFGTQRERTVEWACTAYWVGRAQERGLRVHVPRRSSIARHFGGRYGFEYAAEHEAVQAYVQSGVAEDEVPIWKRL